MASCLGPAASKLFWNRNLLDGWTVFLFPWSSVISAWLLSDYPPQLKASSGAKEWHYLPHLFTPPCPPQHLVNGSTLWAEPDLASVSVMSQLQVQVLGSPLPCNHWGISTETQDLTSWIKTIEPVTLDCVFRCRKLVPLPIYVTFWKPGTMKCATLMALSMHLGTAQASSPVYFPDG